MRSKRIAPPEFWRFVFILFICVLHFEEDVYDRHHILAYGGYLGVDFFLLLAGFTVALNHDKSPITSPLSFVYGRVKRLYPEFLFAIFLMMGLWIIYNSNGFLHILGHIISFWHQYFFLNAIFPSGLEMRSIWFLSYWILGILFLASILKSDKLLVSGGVVLCALSWHYYHRGTFYSDPAKPDFIFSVRLIKCLSEVIVGGVVYKLYKEISKYDLTSSGRFLFSVIEIGIVSVVLLLMTCKGRSQIDYEICFGFIAIILFSFWKKTYLSRLLDNKVSIFLGRMSLPIYLYHLFTVKIVAQYCHNSDNKTFVYLGTLISIFITSYLFHQFVDRFFKRFLAGVVNKLVVRK